MKIYSVPENDTFKAKAVAWAKNRITDAKDFWDNNKRELVILIPIIPKRRIVKPSNI